MLIHFEMFLDQHFRPPFLRSYYWVLVVVNQLLCSCIFVLLCRKCDGRDLILILYGLYMGCVLIFGVRLLLHSKSFVILDWLYTSGPTFQIIDLKCINNMNIIKILINENILRFILIPNLDYLN